MAATNKVSIEIEAADNASQKLDQVEDSVMDLGKIAGVALGGAVVAGAAKAAFELAELGAQSLRTKAAFAAISGGSEEAAANLEAMQRATQGAVSEQQAMASANQLMQMGLANNSEELENMSTMAVRLGTAMGLSLIHI